MELLLPIRLTKAMKTFLPFALLATIGLVACGGVGGGTIDGANAVVVVEKSSTSPVSVTLTRDGNLVSQETEPCNQTATTWCTATQNSTEERFDFRVSSGRTPYRVYFTNSGTTNQDVTVKIFLSGVERLNRTISIQPGTTPFEGASIN